MVPAKWVGFKSMHPECCSDGFDPPSPYTHTLYEKSSTLSAVRCELLHGETTRVKTNATKYGLDDGKTRQMRPMHLPWSKSWGGIPSGSAWPVRVLARGQGPVFPWIEEFHGREWLVRSRCRQHPTATIGNRKIISQKLDAVHTQNTHERRAHVA